MTSTVLHAVICDRATRDNISGKLTCVGISPRLSAEQFPHNATFSLVAWLSGMNEDNNAFTVVVSNRDGKIIGTKGDHKAVLQPGGEAAEFMFHFNQFIFNTLEDFYTVEIHHGTTVVLKKVIYIVQAPRVKPFNAIGDKGYVALG